MPYLEYLFCEHCGNYARLDIDSGATIDAYRAEGRKNVSILQPTLIWDYLIYSCGICERKYKYTYRDVEHNVREYFSSMSQEFKDYFDKVVAGGNAESTEPPSRAVPSAEERVRGLYTSKK